MRYRGIDFLPVVLLLAGGCGGLEWEKYHSDEGRFSILMPDEPDEESYDAATPAGSLPVYAASVEQDSLLYLVTCADLPEYLSDTAAPEEFLGESQAWGLGGLQGKVLRDSSVMLGEYPGRTFLLQRPDGALHRISLYTAGGRLYQVMMSGPAGIVGGRHADRFFDSFSIDD